MNTNKGIGILAVIAVIAVLAALGGGVYLATQNRVEIETSDADDDVETVESATSLRSLLSLGRDVVCTFSRVDEMSAVSGVVYVADQNIRGDFDVRTESTGTMKGHMIKVGNEIYTWSDAFTQGVKLAVDAEAEMKSNEQNPVGLDDEVEYECDSWNKDASKFSVPGNINFIELNAGASGTIETGAPIESGVPQCAACRNLPDGDAQAACLAVLGC